MRIPCQTRREKTVHDRLPEIVTWASDTFGIKSIGFNILVDRTPELMGMDETSYAKTVTQELIRTFKICREIGIYEDRILKELALNQ